MEERLNSLCEQCKERFERNPLRILDCKERECRIITRDAPSIIDHLCEECNAHFSELKELLKQSGVVAHVNPKIVRGLDYYTKTVFEVIMNTQRGDLALLGGGRYDGLVEQIGGPAMPGVGFGISTERILLELQNQKILPPENTVIDIFIAKIDENVQIPAFQLVQDLRQAGIKADSDHMRRSLKAQFRYADKLGVNYLIIMGGDEFTRGMLKLKNMKTGEEQEILFKDALNIIKNLI